MRYVRYVFLGLSILGLLFNIGLACYTWWFIHGFGHPTLIESLIVCFYTTVSMPFFWIWIAILLIYSGLIYYKMLVPTDI